MLQNIKIVVSFHIFKNIFVSKIVFQNPVTFRINESTVVYWKYTDNQKLTVYFYTWPLMNP